MKDKIRLKRAIVIKGRNRTCQNQGQLRIFNDKHVNMSWEFCSNHCGMFGDCSYTKQFDDPLANIRIMTHDEWRNEQSAWFNGRHRVDRSYEPLRGRNAWKPDLIVIDEDFVRVDAVVSEAASPIFPSLRLVIESTVNGASLRDAVWMHRQQVLMDDDNNSRISLPGFTNAIDYVETVSRNRSFESYSPILARLAEYCRYEENSLLDGIWVEGEHLCLLPVRLAAKRYRDVPTLYLDATASEAVVRKLLPGVQFHRISVKQKEDIRLFQLSDATLSRKYLSDSTNIQTVVNGLKSIASQYKNVGLITYQNTESDSMFYKTLANALDVSRVGYFKNLRGVNEFENVDCLLIVGRFRLPPMAIRNYVRAIFGGEPGESISQYGDLPVRMKDGRTVTLNTYVAGDDFRQAIHDHFSLAETLQALGRARLVHGSAKDIYVFSNENLTSDVAVAGFFRFEDYFGSRTKKAATPSALIATDAIDRAIALGYVQDIEGELISQLGLTESKVKRNRNGIRDKLAAVGFVRRRARIRYINGTTGPRNYLVSDERKLIQALAAKGERLIEWLPVD